MGSFVHHRSHEAGFAKGMISIDTVVSALRSVGPRVQ